MKRPTRRELQAFALAMQFLTRLPGPAEGASDPAQLARSVRYYPLVGALIGGLCAGVFWLAHLGLPGTVAVVLAVATGLATTGALHEDGLADTFDGLGAGGASREHMLTVMRDSRIGTFGAVALAMALLLKVVSLAALAPLAVCLAFVAGHGLSRLSCIVVMQTSTYVREVGVATPLADRLGVAGWLVVLITGFTLVAGVFQMLGPLTAVLALAGLGAGHVLMRLFFERRLGGYSGDTLGAVQQASEVGLYLGVCVGMGPWA